MCKKLDHLPTQLNFEGANNFRDMGGYPLSSGRKVKEGMLFRSDHLGNLTDSDHLKIKELGIKTVVDLRRVSERELTPNRLNNPAIQQIHLPVEEKGADVNQLLTRLWDGSMDVDGAHQYLIDANKAFIVRFAPVFEAFLHLLLDEKNYPLVFHCSAGKDRAGFCAALSLLCLGAELDTVFHDYLATNSCTDSFVEKFINEMVGKGMKSSPQAMRTLLRVKPEFLQAAMDAASIHHGSIEAYIELCLSIDNKKRKALERLLSV